jgi:hypothetical protein
MACLGAEVVEGERPELDAVFLSPCRDAAFLALELGGRVLDEVALKCHLPLAVLADALVLGAPEQCGLPTNAGMLANRS